MAHRTIKGLVSHEENKTFLFFLCVPVYRKHQSQVLLFFCLKLMPSRSFDLDKRCRELLCILPQSKEKNLEKKRKPLWRGNKPTVLFGDRLRFVGLGLFISALHLAADHFCPVSSGLTVGGPRNNARRKRNIYSAKRTSYSILILGQTAAGRVSLMWKNRINIRGSPMVLSFQDSQLWPPESFHHSHSRNVVLTAYLFTTQPSTPSENVQEKKMLGESLPTLNNGTNAPICQSTIYH